MPVSEDDRSARHQLRAGGADHAALRARVREGDGDLLEDAGYFVGYTRKA
jgi:hypothetical protein